MSKRVTALAREMVCKILKSANSHTHKSTWAAPKARVIWYTTDVLQCKSVCQLKS